MAVQLREEACRFAKALVWTADRNPDSVIPGGRDHLLPNTRQWKASGVVRCATQILTSDTIDVAAFARMFETSSAVVIAAGPYHDASEMVRHAKVLAPPGTPMYLAGQTRSADMPSGVVVIPSSNFEDIWTYLDQHAEEWPRTTLLEPNPDGSNGGVSAAISPFISPSVEKTLEMGEQAMDYWRLLKLEARSSLEGWDSSQSLPLSALCMLEIERWHQKPDGQLMTRCFDSAKVPDDFETIAHFVNVISARQAAFELIVRLLNSGRCEPIKGGGLTYGSRPALLVGQEGAHLYLRFAKSLPSSLRAELCAFAVHMLRTRQPDLTFEGSKTCLKCLTVATPYFELSSCPTCGARLPDQDDVSRAASDPGALSVARDLNDRAALYSCSVLDEWRIAAHLSELAAKVGASAGFNTGSSDCQISDSRNTLNFIFRAANPARRTPFGPSPETEAHAHHVARLPDGSFWWAFENLDEWEPMTDQAVRQALESRVPRRIVQRSVAKEEDIAEEAPVVGEWEIAEEGEAAAE